jgi:hypothetical protein
MNYDDPMAFLAATSIIAAIGVVISSLEMLAVRQHYGSGGLFSWEFHKSRLSASGRRRLSGVGGVLFEHRGILLLLVVRILAACTIPFVLTNRVHLLAAAAVVAVSSMLLTVRGTDGRNGADEMHTIIFPALSLSLLSDNALALKAGLWFLALQLNLSYLTSGIYKARERGWWDGSYLRMAFRTEAYGNEGLWKLLGERPRVGRVASVMVIVLECGFFLSLIVPLAYSWPILVAGALFHICNAVISGLNTFVWSYLALYPAVVFCNYAVQHALAGK